MTIELGHFYYNKRGRCFVKRTSCLSFISFTGTVSRYIKSPHRLFYNAQSAIRHSSNYCLAPLSAVFLSA
jgi:hypothetical protein